jgi:trehalose 6-phosphate phosphatase
MAGGDSASARGDDHAAEDEADLAAAAFSAGNSAAPETEEAEHLPLAQLPGAAELGQRLSAGARLWLFLDYDGTLAEFAPTPDTLLPDAELAGLLVRLASFPEVLRVVIMSGRRLSHIRALLPVAGILLAGTYGIEFQTWQGEQVRLLSFETARPFLDQVKKAWAELIDGQVGFYLEDKGYALAIHARLAEEKEAQTVLAQARRSAGQVAQGDAFHILGGSRFIEVAPLVADKGQSVSMLLQRFPWPGAEVVYIGDDDKDEEAFKVVRKNGGLAGLVSGNPRPSAAQYRLNSPRAVRGWLKDLADALERGQAETAARADREGED